MKNLNSIQSRDLEEASVADKKYTPPRLARRLTEWLFSEGWINSQMTFMDPCAGKNAFYNALTEIGDTRRAEIDDGMDFFSEYGMVDWIISNPPFSQMNKWLEHTMLLARQGFAYVMPTYSLTVERLDMINSFGFVCNEVVLFQNPKEWNLGFQMGFYVFTMLDGEPNAVRNLDPLGGVQTRLSV